MKTCVIFNPAARGDRAWHFREHLSELSLQCALKPTTAAGAGRVLAREAVREGFEVIVAAGGDGTVNEVVNGMADEPEGFQRSRLAVVPLGTVNVFARELGLPSRLAPAWDVVQHGRETAIDVAEARYADGSSPRRCCFVQMAGAGVDARAIGMVDREQKKRLGQFAYVVAGFKAIAAAKPQIVVTNGRETVAGQQVLIGNGRFYGGRFALFPLASLRDGLLEATVLTRADWGLLLRGAWNLCRRRLYATRGILHLRGDTLRLSSPAPAMFHIEGELAGALPVTCSVRRAALRVIVPAAAPA
ncbi:MAG: diacylglycerol kinase family lipid kinase [Verrucomicrobia bacterium]|nr:diacylglycerol kinase family lipid kinase [Verrucomicrobiota bacterium]